MPSEVQEPETLSLDEIDAADDRPEVKVLVPEWKKANGKPGAVTIKALTYDQLNGARQHAWNTSKKEVDEDVLNAWCLALGVVAPAVSFAKAKGWICNKSFGSVNTVLAAILNASGLGAKAIEDAKSEAGGNA